jgi:hypothetical protein
MRYWKLLVPLVAVAFVLYSFKHVQHQRDVAIAELASYKQAQAVAVAKATAENTVKEATAQTKVDDTVRGATAILTQLNLNHQQSTTDLKDLYESKISKLKHDMAWHPGSVLPTAAGDNSTTGNSASNSEVSASSWQECDGTLTSLQGEYSTLEKACQIETVDFNVLRIWADAVCETIECVDKRSEIKP